MGRPGLIWGVSIGGLIALDYWAHTNNLDGDTLSEHVRAIYRTDTAPGRVALVVSWAALSAWVIPHWCKTPSLATEQDRSHG